MKALIDIYRRTFLYRGTAVLVIVSNILFVIFNLISLVLFIPFLQLLFRDPKEKVELVAQPFYSGGFLDFFTYCSKVFQYEMQQMVLRDPKDALFFICITMLTAFFFKNLFRYMAVYHQSQLRMAVVRDLRDKLFQKAMKLPLSFYTNEKKGDIMSRMNSDANEIEVAVIAMLELIFREPISLITYLGVLIYWSPSLTLFSLILMPISALIIALIRKSLKRTAKNQQEQMGVLFSVLEENLTGI